MLMIGIGTDCAYRVLRTEAREKELQSSEQEQSAYIHDYNMNGFCFTEKRKLPGFYGLRAFNAWLKDYFPASSITSKST